MMARRFLVLACLFLAVAPLQTVSGQETGVADADNVDLDEVLDSLAEAGVAEVSVSGVRLLLHICVLHTYDQRHSQDG